VAQKATETAKQQPTAAKGAADKAATAVQDTAGKVAEEARGAWAALGKILRQEAAQRCRAQHPEFGVENKLIGFIEDAQRPGR